MSGQKEATLMCTLATINLQAYWSAHYAASCGIIGCSAP